MTWHRALPLLLIVLGVGLLASASEPLSNVSDHPAPEGTPMPTFQKSYQERERAFGDCCPTH